MAPTFNTEVTTMIEVDFEVFCDECGAGLCGNTETRNSRRRGEPQAVVKPCDRCIDKARAEGEAEGRETGYSNGHDDGFEKGKREGRKELAQEHGIELDGNDV